MAHKDPEKRREISRRGGLAAQATGNAHKFTAEKAREAGKKGGLKVSANREHMRSIGRMGGKARRSKIATTPSSGG